ncbi:MAG: FprA family A-type flavoprotein [Candidatus Thermoplasmatota archaeon]|nr:FprA family A-type flavoprotein [Candidatus Thermoplasmatota archaeon]
MKPEKIREGVYSVGVLHWDRRLFDALIPLPDGTSYNSYLVKGTKATALIDAVDPVLYQELLQNLELMGVEKLDYIIANHGEQDHSGAIPHVLERYPEAKVVTNAKCKAMLMDHLLIPEEKFIVKEDGETLDLGGKTLETIIAPWVHWPETQFVYLKEDKILFTCDFLGAHQADSRLYAGEKAEHHHAAKRYYAEIMMPFAHMIPKHLDRIEKMDVEIIAPSHGPVHDRPKYILGAYRKWSSPDTKNEAIVAYVSMHDSTRKMADHLIRELGERGIRVKAFNLENADIGELAMALVDARTIIIGTPTVLTGPHPQAVYAAYLANALRAKTKYATVIGSYGWGGKAVETIAGMLPNLKAEILEPVYIKGCPKEADFQALTRLADTIKQKHDVLEKEA